MKRLYSAMVITVFSSVPRRMIIKDVNSSAYIKVTHIRRATKRERAEFNRKERMYREQPIQKRDARKMRIEYRKEQERIKGLYEYIRSRYPDSYGVYRCEDEGFDFIVYDTDDYEIARY